MSNEITLWTRVLWQAIADAVDPRPLFVKTEKGRRKLRRKAREWLSDDEDRIGSFWWVCRILDIDGAAVREVVRDVEGRPAPERKAFTRLIGGQMRQS